MRSIRLSLMVYFLGLLGVALGVASLFVYRTAQQTLTAKEDATRSLIEAQYEERSREAQQRLDDQLLAQARSLAGRVRPRYRWENAGRNSHIRLNALSILTTHLGPAPQYGSLVNILQAVVFTPNQKGARWVIMHPLQFQLWRHQLMDLDLNKDVVPDDDAGWSRLAYRIDTNGWSSPLFSPEGTVHPVVLPHEGGFAPDQRLTWDWDDYRPDHTTPARRIRFRALITLQDNTPPVPGGKGPRPPGDLPSWPLYRPPPASIIIQCAADAREIDGILQELRNQRDLELESLRSETDRALAQHRNRLLLISAFTFGATVLGSFLLVWLGLMPLARLSDAVSKVSPKNFRLDIDARRLPTELHPIAERLGTSLEMLKRAFSREKQATADISHELRTPLAALITTIDLALRKERTTEQYREFLSDCRLSATQMHQIVERLLTLARLDAGVDRLRAQAVDASELAEQCAAVIRPLAEARGLSLAVYNRGEAAVSTVTDPLMTDPDKLREILTNLLHNAVQYNRPQGRIDLTVTRENGRVRFDVSDTGIGITPEAREHIFERFYRADPSRNADDLHAGLGLAIVKEYIDLMGGKIIVESQEGQGSTFRIELPVHQPAQAG